MRRDLRRVAIAVPVLAGLGLLGAGLLLLPGAREVMHAERRAHPAVAPTASSLPVQVAAAPLPASEPLPTPVPLPPAPPRIAALVPHADARTLAAMTARLVADGQAVSTLQVAYDLVAARRPAVALAYLAARPDGASAATWRLRVDLLHRTGRTPEAAALVAQAARGRSGVVPADLIAAAYAVGRPDLIVVAAASGAIPPPDAALALDLARRADAAGRSDLIAALDRSTRADWRAADPWLAIRVAARTNDTAAALRAVDRLPADQREAARETILTRTGDRAALRTLLLARAATDPVPIAERLLTLGYRADAIATLRQATTGRPPAGPATQRLLYLMGPRPTGDDLAWLRQQTLHGREADQLAWLAIYADRDRPADALAFVSRHPLAQRTEVMLTRASLAKAAGDANAGRALVAALLDGRPLTPDQLRRLSAAAPARLDPTQTAKLARARVATGVASPREKLDLAWAAWNAGDAETAAGWLRAHLIAQPTDLAGLRLMADVQAKIGGERAARPWLERALAQTPPDGRARAELLDRLGRRAEAVALVENLRAETPRDRSLAALQARLLIAQGQPGRARAVLAE